MYGLEERNVTLRLWKTFKEHFGFLNRSKKACILTFHLSLSRTALSEKKPTVKPKSPEKSKPEEKDPEKSPTKKQEGSSCMEFFCGITLKYIFCVDMLI